MWRCLLLEKVTTTVLSTACDRTSDATSASELVLAVATHDGTGIGDRKFLSS